MRKIFAVIYLMTLIAQAQQARAQTPERVGPPLAATAAAPTVTMSSTVPINISTVANTYAIATDGTTVKPTGIDGSNSALLLSTVKSLGLGAPDVLDAVKNTTVTLPAVNGSSLNIVAVGVDGNQLAQKFTVNYTDGSTTVYTQSVSDWWAAQHYAGETVLATATPIQLAAKQYVHTVSIYSYTITLNSNAKLMSLTLPPNNHVVMLAGSVVTAAPVFTPNAPPHDVVILSWSAPSINVDGSPASIASYNIYKGTPSTMTKYASVQSPTTTFTEPLPCGPMVNYAVSAVSTAGVESDVSPQVGKTCWYSSFSSAVAVQ